MLKHVDECVGCPPEKGCLGSACPNRNVPRWFCDECENEFERDELRVFNGKQLCYDCLCEEVWFSAEEPEDES